MILKFNTCLLLMKDIEYVVRNITNTQRNVYHLQKPSEHPMEIKDDDEDSTQFFMIDYQEIMKDDEEEKEKEATKEEKEDDEETNLVKIAIAIIASLPHSPAKPTITSSLEIASKSMIVATTDTSNFQSLFAHS